MPTENTPTLIKVLGTPEHMKVAQAIVDELQARKDRRKDLERHWNEIERQLRMQPEVSHKTQANGKKVKSRAWMPEVELPLQAQTLEMLTSDARRLIFPPNRDWFSARAALTTTYLTRYGKAGSPFPGERGAESRSHMNQDNADMLVQALLSHWHSLYDFRAHIDVINAQAFAYGFGVGRLRMVEASILGHDMRTSGISKKIPVLVPRNSRKVYLDDNEYSYMHEGYVLGPNIIQCKNMLLDDLKLAAEEDSSFIQANLAKINTDKSGVIEVIELEGDIVADGQVFENVCVMVAKGNEGSVGVIAAKEADLPTTYQVHIYHKEMPGAYGTSPLLKGMPVAKAAAQSLNRVIESGLLKTQPPLGYDKDNPTFAQAGGPVIFPGAQWPTTEDVNVYEEIGGDPTALFAVFTGLNQMYTDVTGVNPPRLGAQTKSHTTAFAKDVEISQGSIRTVDYVRSILEGPMTRLLGLEYRLGLQHMSGRETLYVQAWNEFVQISKQHLPDIVKFTAIGSGAPAEDEAKMAKRLSSIQLALQVEQIAAQMFGREPTLNVTKIIEQIISEGGWPDVATFTEPEVPPEGAQVQPGMGGPTQLPGVLSGSPTSLEPF